MQTQKLYEKIMKRQLEQGIELGRKQGIEQGIERGIEQGIEQGIRDAISQVSAARGLKLSATHRAKIAAQSDAATLRLWLTRAAVAARAAEIFAAS